MELGSAVGAVRSNRVVIGEEVRPAVIVIKGGKIHQIVSHGEFSGDSACEVSSLSLLSLSEYMKMG